MSDLSQQERLDRNIEQGRKLRLREWWKQHGYVFEIHDDILGSWYVRGDSLTVDRAIQSESQSVEIITS
jgi:hypothetical protein